MLVMPPGSPARPAELEEQLARAYRALGEGYQPRTRHREDGTPRYTNRLVLESSPYLLQHAHNPVDWWPWGDAAFEEARRRGVPVFLSVGYATCHWCHVMEHESFEDEGVAALLNEEFVPVKMDREERPDVDAIYMLAVQVLTGQGGWPMSVWLNHEREPFFAGTYFPPHDHWGRPGFATLLRRLSDVWTTQRLEVTRQAEQLARVVRTEISMPSADTPSTPTAAVLHRAAQHYLHQLDPEWGGFGGAPKFPRPDVIRFLLRYHRRTGDDRAREAAVLTLDAMQRGGIYDHVGGGFARYSTDRRWLVPHFEKMLYDNALLALTYVEAFQATGDARHARTAEDVLEYVAREMTSPEGGFYSATDADSEGEEGKFFVWTPEEIDSVLGPEQGRVVRAWYGVTDAGNFEGRNILHTWRRPEEVADELGMGVEELRATVSAAREPLRAARAEREPPLLDDKVITAWNGLMISACAVAGRVLGRPDFVELARRAADFVLGTLGRDDGLARTWRAGAARHRGTLEDHAALALGCLDLLESTGEARWLEAAVRLHEAMEARFRDPRGGYFSTADDVEGLLARPREVHDGAVPSGTSMATLGNLRLAALTGERRWREAAEAALEASGGVLDRHPSVAPLMLSALDWVLDRPWEVVVIRPEGTMPGELDARMHQAWLPNAVRLSAEEGSGHDALAALSPLVRERGARGGAPTAWVCVEGACQAPTGDAEAMLEALREVRTL